MTQEEKAKAYDKAIEKIKYVMEHGVSPTFNKEDLEDIFPELKESEDERIRNEITELVMQPTWKTEKEFHRRKELCAWLEKQGEHKSIDDLTQQEAMDIAVAKCFEQGEQKHIDKVEPQFKVGDWITSNYNNVAYIESISDTKYNLQCKDGFHEKMSIEYIDRNWHLWTIQDAEDGDVLAYVTDEEDLWIMIYRSLYEPYEGHVHYHALLVNDNFSDKGTCCICINDLKPATKEQRDLLFQKIREAGYEWDAEKKELRKIEKQGKKKEINPTLQEKDRMDDAFTKMMLKPQVDGFDAELNALLKKYEHLSKKELQEPLEFYLGVVRDDLDIVREEKPKWSEEEIKEAQLDYWRSVGGKEWHGVPVQETIAWLEKQKGQKWTDEDEIGSDATIELLEYFINYAPEFRRPTIRRSIDWLKSIKKRMEE